MPTKQTEYKAYLIYVFLTWHSFLFPLMLENNSNFKNLHVITYPYINLKFHVYSSYLMLIVFNTYYRMILKAQE
jgi:hypothetical protein